MLQRMFNPQEVLSGAGVDALWITRPENVRWISGFSSPEDGRVLLTREGTTLYTDARYTLQAREEASVAVVIGEPPRDRAEREMYADVARQVGGGRLGFEADHLTVAALDKLRAAVAGELLPTEGLLDGARAVKDADEIGIIREAQRMADEAYAEVLPTIVAGRRERDVALDLELAMRRRGAEAAAFTTIVASGGRGAMPHGVASDKLIEDGELVTVDMGARLRGYHSDMTRTLAVGQVSEKLRRLYQAVLEAEETCVAAVRPGARTADLDALAREILGRHDLAQYFSHSLGHGVGLAVHEGPGLGASSQAVLESGMVVTVEPGVYLPGIGGVRIEDLVLVTPDGHEVLSSALKAQL